MTEVSQNERGCHRYFGSRIRCPVDKAYARNIFHQPLLQRKNFLGEEVASSAGLSFIGSAVLGWLLLCWRGLVDWHEGGQLMFASLWFGSLGLLDDLAGRQRQKVGVTFDGSLPPKESHNRVHQTGRGRGWSNLPLSVAVFGQCLAISPAPFCTLAFAAHFRSRSHRSQR